MNTQWRLDSKAPDVADTFRKATPDRRRQAALAACEIVTSIVGLEGDDVKAALAALREGRPRDPALQERLVNLSARFDDKYFRLDEESDEAKKPEVLRLFSKARAAAALVFALSENSTELHEAIYEALSAADDVSAVVRAVEAALR
jgi:hypothetical protein